MSIDQLLTGACKCFYQVGKVYRIATLEEKLAFDGIRPGNTVSTNINDPNTKPVELTARINRIGWMVPGVIKRRDVCAMVSAPGLEPGTL